MPKNDSASEDRFAQDFHKAAGEDLVDACASGDSEFLRNLANAIDTWKKHSPQPLIEREAILLIDAKNRREGKSNTVREIISVFKKWGIPVDGKTPEEIYQTGSTPKKIYRICRELKIEIKGKSGKPKNEHRYFKSKIRPAP